MTAVAEAPQPGTEALASPQSAVIGIIAGEGVQIGVLLDANAPVSVMVDPLLKVVNVRLREMGLTALEAKQRGRWALCLVDGTPLRATQSLTEQDIYDGDRLWLRFVEDTEQRSQVIEHISTAVSVNLSKRFSAVNPAVAIQVGALMVGTGVLLASLLLGWFRWQHDSWVPAPYALVIAILTVTVALLILGRSQSVGNRRAGDILLWSGVAPFAVSAAAAPPGPVGSPNAVMGFAVAGVAAMLILRFTGRRLGAGTAIVTISLVATAASLARMVFGTGAVTLLTTILLVCVFGYHSAPALSRWMSGIRLPVFPSATSRWVFEARPDLPTTVVHPLDGGRPTLEGPESIGDVVLRAERARSFLTGLLVGLGVLTIVSLAGWPSSSRSKARRMVAAMCVKSGSAARSAAATCSRCESPAAPVPGAWTSSIPGSAGCPGSPSGSGSSPGSASWPGIGSAAAPSGQPAAAARPAAAGGPAAAAESDLVTR